MEHRVCRPLLPHSREGETQITPEYDLKRRKTRSLITRVACNTCRVKKSACDGNRPVCNSCRKRKSQCVYMSIDKSETPTMVRKREHDALRQRSVVLEELVEQMRTASEDVAQSILQKLRESSDLTLVVDFIKESVPDYTKTNTKSTLNLQQIEPTLSSPFRHPNPCPAPFSLQSKVPEGNGWINSSSLPKPNDSESLAGPSSRYIESHNTNLSPDTFVTMTESDTSSQRSASQTSYGRGIMLFDPHLEHFDTSFWTKVPISNQYAAAAISLYLEIDHPVLGLFDAELFCNDLVTYQHQYCSPFLVSSLLAFASQTYSWYDPEATQKSFQFEREAEELWAAQELPDSKTTLFSLILLFKSIMCHRDVERAQIYNSTALDMASRMKWDGVQHVLGIQDFDSLSVEMQNAVAQAAWEGPSAMIQGW